MADKESERHELTDHVIVYLKKHQTDPLEAISALVSLCVTISARAGRTEDQLLQDVRNGFNAARIYDALQGKPSRG